MHSFCNDLATSSFVKAPAIAAVEPSKSIIHDLGCFPDRPTPLIYEKLRKKQLDGCQTPIVGPYQASL